VEIENGEIRVLLGEIWHSSWVPETQMAGEKLLSEFGCKGACAMTVFGRPLNLQLVSKNGHGYGTPF
jgi:hypothetical protein